MITGTKIIHNGILSDAFDLRHSDSSIIIYEVIRVMDGVCLFIEDHIARLMNSARLAGERLPLSEPQFILSLNELVAANNIRQGNIKLVIEMAGGNKNYSAYFITHYYPSSEQYINGVKVVALKAERTNPNAKIWQSELKQKVDLMLKDKSIYEVALFDYDGFITEGSKSNLFFVKDDAVVTAPYNRVLPGVTRKYVLQACIRLKIDINENCLHYRELPSLQAAFISGTSPKVLPIAKIDTYNVPVKNDLLRTIMNEYDTIVNEYLQKQK